jgi:hypothetical protein
MYDGVVTLADDDIPVIVELDDDYVRMSAGGTDIGHWPADECQITHVSDTTYAITAEDETLRFVPNQPSLFAAAVNGASETTSLAKPAEPEPESGRHGAGAEVSETTASDGVREAPAPQPLTMGLFYALCLTTAALAVWALIRIVFF